MLTQNVSNINGIEIHKKPYRNEIVELKFSI